MSSPVPSTTEAPPPSYYNCDFVDKLPYQGTEILVIAGFFMLLIVNFAVSFFSVIAKQLWPSLLDPVVANRLLSIQEMFPGLGSRTVEGNNKKVHTFPHPDGVSDPIEYDAVCAAEPYISSKSVDEDLIVTLANNQAFGTVSEYCTCTTRGYAMLSTMLLTSGMALSFMWIRNVIVDPTQGGWFGSLSLIGYMLCFFTGMVMTGCSQKAVYRNANIFLTTNIPMHGAASKMLKFHTFGIVSFCLIPMIVHLVYALGNKDKMPNYNETMIGIAFQLVGALAFATCSKLPGLTGDKLGIAAELFVVFSSYLAFVSYEYYATAACAGHVGTWHTILIVAMLAPFGFVARHFCWAPTSFSSAPALLLMNNGQPVASVGPCPAVAFDDANSGISSSSNGKKSVVTKQQLPHVKME